MRVKFIIIIVLLLISVCIIPVMALDDPWEGYVPEPLTGVEPLTINFTSVSYNSPTAWNWSFKDVTGNNTEIWFSQTRNVSYTFNTGNFSIRLNSSNTDGYNITPVLAFVNVTPSGAVAPIASFTSNQTSGIPPLPVKFNDSSSYTPTSWNWSFLNMTPGNNTRIWFSQLQNVTYTFGNGNWSIILNATNAVGSDLSDVTWINVSSLTAPVSSFIANQTSGITPFPVKFNDTSTNTPTSWNWSALTYVSQYPLVQSDVYVKATSTYSSSYYPYFATDPAKSLTGSATDNSWESANGNIINQRFHIDLGSAKIITRIYYENLRMPSGITTRGANNFALYGSNTAGSFENVTYTNDTGWVVLTTSQTTFDQHTSSDIRDPKYITVYSNSEAYRYYAIKIADNWGGTTFIGLRRVELQSENLTYFSQLNNVTYTFGTGNWSVKLNTSNAVGFNVSAQTTFINVSPLAPVASFTANQTSGTSPYPVKFNDTSINTPISWNWSFQNLTPGNNTQVWFSQLQNVTYTFGNGNWSIILNTTNGGGTDLSDVTWVNVSNGVVIPPVASFTSNQTSGASPYPVKFNDTSTNTPTSWNWSFQNLTPGNNTQVWFSQLQNVTYTFGNGNWSIVLNATNTVGTDLSDVTWINVSNATMAPIANFTSNVTTVVVGQPIQFNDTSTGGIPTSWSWTFGEDLFSDSNQNPVYQYINIGHFSVQLVVTNAGGSNSSLKIQYINVTIATLPIPSFTANQTSGTSPLPVKFNDTSTGIPPTAWNWSFQNLTPGNNTQIWFSQLKNVTYTFGNGNWSIILNASNANGTSSSSVTWINVSNATMPPVTSFTANKTSGYTLLAVKFNDTSTNTPIFWNWSFRNLTPGNNTQVWFSQVKNVTYIFGVGNWSIALNASNTGGNNISSQNTWINISGLTGFEPIVSFTSNVTLGIAQLPVQFNDTSTGLPISWNWSFQDIRGNVTGIGGFQSSYTDGSHMHCEQRVIVGVGLEPTIGTPIIFTGSIPAGWTPGATYYVVITGSGYFKVSDTLEGSDKSWVCSSDYFITSWTQKPTIYNETQNPVHIFDKGNWLITLTATNVNGSNITPGIYFINVSAPIAVFNVTPNPALVSTPVSFVDMSANGPTAWNWSFGDGIYSNNQHVAHIFSTSGIFTVTLIVNNVSSYSQNVSIYPSTPVANFTVDHNIGSNPLIVQFTDTSSGNITNWNWVFNDGSTSTEQNPNHTYSSLGTYFSQLTVTNSVGTNISQPVIIYIVNSAIPVVDFSGAPVSGSAPLSVQFTDMSVALGAITEWNWSFGEGNYSNLQNPVHIYTSTGQYSVTLVATSGILSNYTVKTGYINVGISSNTVSANFIANSTYAATYPATIQFIDTSVCNPVCTNWAWDLNGDGAVDSLSQNPIYVYTYPGNYSPKLVVSNGLNTGTKIRNLYITIGPIFVLPTIPQPSATWHPGYQTNGTPFMFRGDTSIDLANSTFLKYWLQNFSATGNFSIYGFTTGIMAPLMHVFGFWVFLIIWGLYLFAVWIRSQDVTMPLIIGILSIGTFGLLFPKESLPVIIIMFVICGAIIISKLLKD